MQIERGNAESLANLFNSAPPRAWRTTETSTLDLNTIDPERRAEQGGTPAGQRHSDAEREEEGRRRRREGARERQTEKEREHEGEVLGVPLVAAGRSAMVSRDPMHLVGTRSVSIYHSSIRRPVCPRLSSLLLPLLLLLSSSCLSSLTVLWIDRQFVVRTATA